MALSRRDSRLTACSTCLGVTLSCHSAFIDVERLGKLIRPLLQTIALLHEFSQLARLLLHETLDVGQPCFGDLTGLTRALCELSGFSDRNLPNLAFLSE